jgi:hypothetical protein
VYRRLVGASVAVGVGAALSASVPISRGYSSEDRVALNALVKNELNTWSAANRLADAFASKRR